MWNSCHLIRPPRVRPPFCFSNFPFPLACQTPGLPASWWLPMRVRLQSAYIRVFSHIGPDPGPDGVRFVVRKPFAISPNRGDLQYHACSVRVLNVRIVSHTQTICLQPVTVLCCSAFRAACMYCAIPLSAVLEAERLAFRRLSSRYALLSTSYSPYTLDRRWNPIFEVTLRPSGPGSHSQRCTSRSAPLPAAVANF